MRRDPTALASPCALALALAGAPVPAAAAGFDPPAALSAPTLDPRAPVSHYQVLSGRHSSRLGLRVAAPSLKRWAVHESTTLDAFFALDNWSRAVPISYQTVRAHVGLDTSWASPWLDARLPAGQRAAAQLGYFHESDHVTDVNDFAAAYAPDGTTAGLDAANPATGGFDWNNWSSYELVRGRLRLTQPIGPLPWTLRLSADGRRYLPPINAGGVRGLRWGWGAEAWLERALRGTLSAYGAARIDVDHATLDPTTLGLRAAGPTDRLPLVGAELGLDLGSAGPHVQLALVHRRGSGQGADFFVDHGAEWGLGLRVWR